MEKTVPADLEKRIGKLREELALYQKAYYVDSRPLVSDLEYDRLFDELCALERDNPQYADPNSPTVRVGSDLSSDFPEFSHTIPVLSLDKAYSSQAVLSWTEKSIEKARSDLSFVIEEKIDGLSMVLYYEKGLLVRAVTRGNGFVGNEVTANIRTLPSVPLKLSQPVDIVVRGEVYLPKDAFEKINSTLEEPYANPRNLAAGSIRRIKSSETARVPLTIFCYEGFTDDAQFGDHIQILAYLRQLGFRIDPNIGYFCRTAEQARARLKEAGLENFVSGSFEDIPAYIQRRTRERGGLPYEIDGLVCKVDEISVRNAFGYTGHHPRWALAYKFEAPQAETRVLGIDVQIGRTGRVTPVARVVPASVGGSTISNITLHNQDYVDQLELAIGDTVAISRRGDVIPAVESVVEKNEEGNTTWRMPECCPYCGTALVRRGGHHFCPNYSCPMQAKLRISFFTAKGQMDMEGFGPETVSLLFDNGYVRCVEDLFDFDFSRLGGVRGFGDKKVAMLRSSVENTRKASFRQVVTSLGIPEIGSKAVDSLCDSGLDSMDRLLDVADRRAVDELLAVDQIGEKTALLLIDGLNDPNTRNLIAKLRSYGLKMEDEKNAGNLSQIFSGQSWCITGSFESFASRDLIVRLITDRGGKSVSAVSSKTSVLLAGQNAGSKLAKARELGVKIIGEEEFLSLIGRPAGEEKPAASEPVQGELF